MDFDTNHPKLIIAAVACDRNGLTNEAAAFSVKLSAFFIRRTPAVHKTVAFRLTRSSGRFVDTKSQVSFFSLPNFLFQRYFIADTVVFQGYRPYGRQAKSHSRAI